MSRAADYSAQQGYHEARQRTAQGALEVAKLALKGTEATMGGAHHLAPVDADPRIVALFAQKETATIALQAAKGSLEVTEHAISGAALIAEQIVGLALGEIFDLRNAYFAGYFGGQQTMRVTMNANIIFLRRELDIVFEFDFADVERSVLLLVEKLIDENL